MTALATPRGQTASLPSDREVMRPTSHSSHFQSAAGGNSTLADAADSSSCPPNAMESAAPNSVSAGGVEQPARDNSGGPTLLLQSSVILGPGTTLSASDAVPVSSLPSGESEPSVTLAYTASESSSVEAPAAETPPAPGCPPTSAGAGGDCRGCSHASTFAAAAASSTQPSSSNLSA